MRTLLLGIAFTVILAPVSTVTAQVFSSQVFPSRPITMIVRFPAGGPNDTIGRIVTERMRLSLGQPVVIENVAGANGTIGTPRWRAKRAASAATR
jgi:tripartite-type tricarboxylate transporter receptor subunit TctC